MRASPNVPRWRGRRLRERLGRPEPERGFEPLTYRLQVGCATVAPPGRLSSTAGVPTRGRRRQRRFRAAAPAYFLLLWRLWRATRRRADAPRPHATRRSVATARPLSQSVRGART